MRALVQPLKRLASNKSGSVAITFAIATIAVVLTAGLAIDSGRVYNVASKVRAAADAAALAGAKALDGKAMSDDAVKAFTRNYFDVHMQNLGVTGVNIAFLKVTPDRSKSTVKIEADVTVDTTFGRIAGIDRFTISPDTEVEFKQKKVELAMVLDVTGSMNDAGKLIDMKDAATQVINIMIEENAKPDVVRIAIAPYSSSVNVAGFSADIIDDESGSCVNARTGSDRGTDAVPNVDDFPVHNPTGTHGYCPVSRVVPLRDDKDLLTTAITQLVAEGYTAGHTGAEWGWFLISPQWRDVWGGSSKPEGYSDKGVIKSVLIMTDGMFNTAYNIDDGQSMEDASYARFQTICAGMRAKGIKIYTVGFEITPGGRAETELKACAGPASNYFLASDRAALLSAFTTIATRLMSLRLTR
ncbi:MAG: pilus assembly protein TadG-related protein [Pseudomonadota bacterium]